jgi:hypothetical protein
MRQLGERGGSSGNPLRSDQRQWRKGRSHCQEAEGSLAPCAGAIEQDFGAGVQDCDLLLPLSPRQLGGVGNEGSVAHGFERNGLRNALGAGGGPLEHLLLHRHRQWRANADRT